MADTYRQDMPPPGGFREFNWRRTYPKLLWKPKIYVSAVGIMGLYGYWHAHMQRNQMTNQKLTDVDLINSFEPFLLAERDRRWLKVMRKHREIENDLMKNIPGWKAGTWYGEPVYFTLGDRWFDPWSNELYGHSPAKRILDEQMWRHQTGNYSAPKFYDKYIPEYFWKFLFPHYREHESLEGKVRT